ncbi:hypothetical protein [Nocardia sp. NPDC057030]|uniref:hypothetical protein n=1 Tax=unclassified Nocardia TaxID=2637762 RepID=UPI0036428ACE
MSAVYDAFNNDEKLWGRALNASAHFMLWAIAVVALCGIPAYFGIFYGPLQLISNLALVFVVIGAMHNMYTRLCVRCMREVPADASSRAERQWWILLFNHGTSTVRGLLGWFALLGATYWFVHRLDFPPVAQLPADVATFLYLYSCWLHHRLRPWCPYCPDWGGGGVAEPSPDPVTKATI